MPNYGGMVWGTNRGFVSVQFAQDNGNPLHEGGAQGEWVLDDLEFGRTSARIVAHIEGNQLTGVLSDFRSEQPLVLPQRGNVTGELRDEGRQLAGEWRTDTGTNGGFLLQLGFMQRRAQPAPSALISRPVTFEACKLDRTDLAALLKVATDGTSVTTPGLRTSADGRQVYKLGLEALEDDPLVPNIINDLSISVNEGAVGSGYRLIVINLNSNQPNEMTVTGESSRWVEGTVSDLSRFLRSRRARTNDLYRKYGMNINAILFLFMLVVLPSIGSLQWRAIFMVVAVLFLWGLQWTYNRVLPNTVIFLRQPKIGWWAKHRGEMLAGVLTGIVVVILGILLERLLSGGAQP